MANQKITFAEDRYNAKTKEYIISKSRQWGTTIRDAETRLLNEAAAKQLKQTKTTTTKHAN